MWSVLKAFLLFQSHLQFTIGSFQRSNKQIRTCLAPVTIDCVCFFVVQLFGGDQKCTCLSASSLCRDFNRNQTRDMRRCECFITSYFVPHILTPNTSTLTIACLISPSQSDYFDEKVWVRELFHSEQCSAKIIKLFTDQSPHCTIQRTNLFISNLT